MSDTLQIFGKTFSNATGIVATDNTDTERTFIRPTGTMTIDENGTYDVSEYASAEVSVSGGGDEPIPEDGKTRIFIHIAEDTPDNRLTFYLRFTASEANNTTVDWGDGVSETLGSTTATNYSHKYSQGGDYVITMTANSGTISFTGSSGSTGYGIYGDRTTNKYLYQYIQKIIFGDNINSIGTASLQFCYQTRKVEFPSDITTLAEHVLSYNYSLQKVTIPSTVTSIGASAFAYNNSMSEYHFKSKTPPTLANSNAFTGIPADCKIYVPSTRLSNYKSATNWSQYVNYMVGE